MAKRKVASEDELESNSPHSPNPPTKRNKVPSSSDNPEDKIEPREKKSDMTEKSSNTKDTNPEAVEVLKSADGENYVSLGKKKRVTVRRFRNQPLIDIREFYGPDGDEKPGKKGISLTSDQWDHLKRSMLAIDDLLSP